MSSPAQIIVIVGPTASGKSDLAIALARKSDGEIISADSRQVYRGMDIGTGKVKRDTSPTSYNRILGYDYKARQPKGYYSQGIRHHLLDVADPKRDFSVARFQRLGRKAIRDILKRGKTPIICGGTGLYVDALVFDTQFPEVKPDKKLRAQFDKLTVEKLFEKLKKLDPARAQTVDHNNKRRLIRALEIVLATKKPIPPLDVKGHPSHVHDVLWIGITMPKEKLAQRIKKRFDAWLRQGLVREVKRLRRKGLSWKRLESFGLEYRWVARYLQGKVTKEETYQQSLRDLIQYSKRQMTWFKRNKHIHWISHPNRATRLAKAFLSKRRPLIQGS